MTVNPVHRKTAYDKANNLIKESKSRPCADCGIQYPWYVMDFDHRHGEKKFNIGKARGVGFNVLKSEIEKCEVVCANCHRLRHPPKSEINSS